MYSSNILKGLRGKRLKTQDDIANKINTSRQMYCTYENNILQCEFNLVFKILNALDINEIELDEFLFALKQDYLSCCKNKE